MKIVNRHNLPEAVFQFLKNDLYDGEKNGKSYSVTELLKPTQEIILTRRHWDKIEIDASGRLWSLFGQGVHAVLEREEGAEPIERLWAEIEGVKVSGKFDRIKDNFLYDFKVTSAITLVYRSRDKEWKEQLSAYRWLYWKKYGKELEKKGKIVAILRDWSDKNIETKNYPQAPIVEISLDLFDFAEVEEALKAKIKILQAIEETDIVPECTKEERWWNEKKQMYMKCRKYCPAYLFCAQAQEELL